MSHGAMGLIDNCLDWLVQYTRWTMPAVMSLPLTQGGRAEVVGNLSYKNNANLKFLSKLVDKSVFVK